MTDGDLQLTFSDFSEFADHVNNFKYPKLEKVTKTKFENCNWNFGPVAK